MITGRGQLEDHAGIARAVLGSRGSGLSAERDAPPWCCVLLNRTAANAQLNGRALATRQCDDGTQERGERPDPACEPGRTAIRRPSRCG